MTERETREQKRKETLKEFEKWVDTGVIAEIATNIVAENEKDITLLNLKEAWLSVIDYVSSTATDFKLK